MLWVLPAMVRASGVRPGLSASIAYARYMYMYAMTRGPAQVLVRAGARSSIHDANLRRV